MKKKLLLFGLFPLLVSAQDFSDQHRFVQVLLNSRSDMQPALRFSPLPFAPLDSIYMYDKLAEFTTAKYKYEYDGQKITKRTKKAYSKETELYQEESVIKYDKATSPWTKRTDFISQLGSNVSRVEYTRSYNEEDYLEDYREYYANYDAPLGDPNQIYSAISFDNDNKPTVYMDTVTINDEIVNNQTLLKEVTVRKWEVIYDNTLIKTITGYGKSGENWSPEIKYVISYHSDFPDRTIEYYTIPAQEWALNGKIQSSMDGRGNLTAWKETNALEEVIQHYTFDRFYDETSTSNSAITTLNPIQIQFDNSYRILTVSQNQGINGYLSVVSVNGSVLLSRKIEQEKQEFSLADLSTGYYIVTVQAGKRRQSEKIFIR